MTRSRTAVIPSTLLLLASCVISWPTCSILLTSGRGTTLQRPPPTCSHACSSVQQVRPTAGPRLGVILLTTTLSGYVLRRTMTISWATMMGGALRPSPCCGQRRLRLVRSVSCYHIPTTHTHPPTLSFHFTISCPCCKAG
jgi:hypothetical protein